jgi:hypothetical protein
MVLQHTWAPRALVPLFHFGNIMVKAFRLLVTGSAKFFRQEVPSVSKNFICNVILHPTLL